VLIWPPWVVDANNDSQAIGCPAEVSAIQKVKRKDIPNKVAINLFSIFINPSLLVMISFLYDLPP
jgi:hypothetical protein